MKALHSGWIALLALGLLSPALHAVTCGELDSERKIRAFLAETKAANPLWRDELSVYLELSPCEGDDCARKNRNRRIALLQNIHLVRTGNKRRVYVMKGPNSGQCLISRDRRDFICSQCDATSNSSCRSIVRDTTSGRIMGTNLDVTDFDPFASEDFASVCSAVEGKAKFLKIETARKSGQGTYERIVSIVDKERGVPVTTNYFADGTLRKVYRFFPKYYVKIGGQWIATIMRVRTTQGSEKQYLFETQVRVLPDGKGGILLFPDPSSDPQLKGYDIHSLFFTD